MRSQCRKCGRMFAGMTAFDAHWKKVPPRAGAPCRHPEEVGLVQSKTGVWGHPAPDRDWRKP